MKRTIFLLIITLPIVLFLATCSNDDDLRDEEQQLLEQYLIDNDITIDPTASGLYYIETSFGLGSSPSPGKTVVVHYTGRLIDGTKFDSSYDRGDPFEFIIGSGQVIKGWDEGIALMKDGGEAILIIPSELGYGSSGAGSIPPYSTLVFEVKLVAVY